MGNMGTFLRAETKKQTKIGVESMNILNHDDIFLWIRNHYDHFVSNQSNQSWFLIIMIYYSSNFCGWEPLFEALPGITGRPGDEMMGSWHESRGLSSLLMLRKEI